MNKGDIILIHGRFDVVAMAIRAFTRSYWNHVGIFVDNSHILEARGNSIVISPARKYIYNKFYDCKIVKIKGLKPAQIKKAIDYMVGISESGYFKWVRACFMCFFDTKRGLPRRTCSGLVAEGFSKIGVYFKKNKLPTKITPGDIAKSKIIKNITGKSLLKKYYEN